MQCGAELEVPIVGAGATAELGIYANIIEFGAMIEKTPDCDLQTKEWFDLNVGAFARFGVIVDFKTIGAIPTVSTTLLAAETFTQCWLPNRSPMETGIGGMPVLTATTIAAPSVSVTISPPAVSVLPDTGSGSGGDSGINLSIITISVPARLPPTPTAVAAPTITPPSFPLSNSSAPAAGTGGGVILTTGAPGSGDDLVTSTVFVTTTYTVTSCAASVINCPATYQKEIIVTATVSSFTTVCPATAVITDVPATTSVAPLPATTSASPEDKPDVQVVHVVSSVVVLVPCATPLAETFTPPAGVVAPTEHVVTGGPYQPTFVPAPVVVAAPSGLPAPPKKYKFDNGTVPSAPGAAKPSTVVPPAGPAPPKKFVETAGAPGSAAVASSFVAIVGAIAGSLLLL